MLDLVNHLDAMVAYWDSQQVCVFANDAYQAWFGKSGAEVVGHTLAELLGPLYALNLPVIQGAYAGQIQVFERAIPTAAGGVRHSLDIDDFKLINGHHGHGAGDQVLIESAARMRRARIGQRDTPGPGRVSGAGAPD